MARKIGAAILAVAGIGSMLSALASSASAIPKPRRPSIAWLSEMPPDAPEKRPSSVRAAIPQKAVGPAAPAAIQPSSAKAAETAPRPLPSQESPKAQSAAPALGRPDAPRPPLVSAIASPKPEAAPAIPKPGAATAQEPAPTPAAAPVPAPAAPMIGREPPKPTPGPVVARAGVAGPELARPALAKPQTGEPAPKPAEAKLAPKPPEAAPAEGEEGTGTLTIASEPPGAEVFLDGASVGKTPIEIDVPAGLHTVRLAAPGGGPEKRQNVHVKAGRTAEVRVGF